MTAYFVTGTGTDIGKTFVTAGLIRHLRRMGEKVSALKPVASGFDMAAAALSDAGVLLDALGAPLSPDALDRISPWRFAAPLSPDMAAAREARTIDFDSVVGFCRDRISAAEGTLLIEGVGGVMVPLDSRHTVLDWMVALDLPAIVVAGTYLGTISHTLTALAVLAQRGIAVRVLVLNETADSGVPIAKTKAALSRFFPSVTIATIAHAKDSLNDSNDFETLWQAIR